MALTEPEFAEVETDAAPEMDSAAFLSLAISGENLVEYLDPSQIEALAQDVLRGFEIDEESMEEWEESAERGVKLASMIEEGRVDPWPNAADAKYPLIASACLQFNARSYPAIVPPDGPVKVKTFGDDPSGGKAARAERVREFMSHQLGSPVMDWEGGIDAMLLRLPATGMVWRKCYYDPIKGVRAENRERVVFNNHAQSLDRMPRLSEEFGLYPHEIQSRIRSGRFIEFDWLGMGGPVEDDDEEAETSMSDDDMAPHYFIEQLRRDDLDGDGYDEPYVVTVHRKTGRVVRVVANFGPDDVTLGPDGGIVSIRAREFYVPYRFWPSFDGSFAGVGLGRLLGNTSERINGLINLIMDSGHLSSLGGGFIGTGLNLKGGPIRIKPGEWKPINASGAKIAEALQPLTFPGPSAVLFQVLGLLIEAGKEVASLSEVMTGDVQRQQTATTTMALIEQGMAVFTAAYKRIFRSLKAEFSLICQINAETVDPGVYNRFHDAQEPLDPAADFGLGDMDIQPTADPREVTNMQKMAKAQFLNELSQNGMVNPQEALMRMLQAAGIENVEALIPQPDPMEQAMQQLAIYVQSEMAQLGIVRANLENQKLASEIEENRAEAVSNLADAQTRREGEVQEMDGARFDRLLNLIQTLSQVNNARSEQRGSGRVARSSGDGGSVQGAPQGGGGVSAPDMRGLLGLGAGQPGQAQGAGIGGGSGFPL